jgi:hypothetical protein
MASKSAQVKEAKGSDQPKDEQIGFHKGSLSTLVKERQELVRILGIVEQLMQMHIGALKELGVDIQKEADSAAAGQQPAQKPKKKPIDEII